ncbi:MAG: ATP-binding protein [Acidimicrobiia bacterium]
MSHRVLLLDHDADARLLFRLAFEPDPALKVVAEAADRDGAVRMAAECRPDVVLVDCSLPGLGPFEALAAIREQAPAAQFVLVSAHSPAELRLASRAMGAVGWLSRELPALRLAPELTQLLAVLGSAERALADARTHLAADPGSPRLARRFVEAALAEWDHGASLNDVVALLVSELVTNAVVHAGSDVELTVQLGEDYARVEVSDDSAVEPSATERGIEATSGRGLAMVEALSRRWGSHPRPGGGKVIWFEVERPLL